MTAVVGVGITVGALLGVLGVLVVKLWRGGGDD